MRAEQLEQPARLAAGAADRCVGCAIAGEHAAVARHLLERERRVRIADVELVDLAAAPAIAALGGVEQLRREPEHRGGDRSALGFVAVE